MKIELISLKIRNFKGLKTYDFLPDGKDICVYAENGVGKTTLKDAFRWCLSGKDSQGDTDFGLRPVDGQNNPIKGLVTSVELCITTDGVHHTYLREHHEKVAKDQSRSYTTKCWIDEVSMPIGRYKAAIAEILPDETYKLLTDPGHFFDDDKFHWTKRREVLTLLPGEISSPTGFEDLLKKINGRDIADYKKILRDRIKGFSDERDEINPRIDENQRNLTEYVEKNLDTAKMELYRLDLTNQLVGLDLQVKELQESQSGRQGKLDSINAYKDALAERKRNLLNDTTNIQGILAEKTELQEAVAKKQQAVTDVENAMTLQTSKIITTKKVLADNQERLAGFRTEYGDFKAKVPVKREMSEFEKVCPTCKQDLPDALRQELLASIDVDHVAAVKTYKAGLKTKADSGNELTKTIQVDQTNIDSLESALADLKEDLGKAGITLDESNQYQTKRLTEIDAQIAENKTVPPEKDDTCIGLEKMIAEAERVIGAPVGEQLEAAQKNHAAYQEQINNLNDLLRQADTAKDIQPRIDALKASENDLAQKIADAEKEMCEVKAYEKAECTIIEDAINGMFSYVTFRLFKEQLKTDENGDIQTVLCCDALLNGVPYRDMSAGQQIFAEVDVFNVLSEHYKLDIPLFVDHAESLTLAVETDSQVIMLEAKTNDLEEDDPDYNSDLPKDYYSELRVVNLYL